MPLHTTAQRAEAGYGDRLMHLVSVPELVLFAAVTLAVFFMLWVLWNFWKDGQR
jgi:hypothetical protein